MRIIISPAKKMKQDTDTLSYYQKPYFLKNTEIILAYMKSLKYEDLKEIWKCNDKIARLNYSRIQTMNLHQSLTPAILSYDGIQYQHIAPSVFETKELNYIERNIRILSGFYGILKPFDGVVPYRLEMQSRFSLGGKKNLYEFWDNKLAEYVFQETDTIINLASKEYSKCIAKYLPENISFFTCTFGENIDGKIIEKGTKVKMARGEMIRFMAENQIEKIEEIKYFNRLDYKYSKKFSRADTYVFVKEKN